MKNREFRMHREKQLDLVFDLINAFRLLANPLDTSLFIQDLFTADEIRILAKRLRIAKLLLKDYTQKQVVDEVKCSYATVTKVKSWLDQKGDGLKKIIAKLPEKYPLPSNLPRGPIEYHLPQTLFALAQYYVSKKQAKPSEILIDNLPEKENLDRNIQKIFDEEFKSLHKNKTFN